MRGKALILLVLAGFYAASAMAQTPAVSRYPDGSGDPDATTCRPPQTIPGSRLPGPQVCKLNSQWALLRKNGEDISADGRDIIPDAKGNAGMSCSMVGGGASGGGQMVCHQQ